MAYQWKGNTIALQCQRDISGKAARYGSVSGLEKVVLQQCLGNQWDREKLRYSLVCGQKVGCLETIDSQKAFCRDFS